MMVIDQWPQALDDPRERVTPTEIRRPVHAVHGDRAVQEP